MDGQTNSEDLENILTIKTYIPSWEKLTPEQIQFDRLGGLSNQIWKVSALNPAIRPKAVLLRKFGAGSEIVDRKKENYILDGLSQNNVGPKLYGCDDKFRIEQFYDSETLNPAELDKRIIERQLAKRLGELHNVQLNDLTKSPAFLKILEGKEFIQKAQEKAESDAFSSEEKKKLKEMLAITTEEEISFLKSILPKDPESITFSHNDLHAENVLMLKKNHKLMLIDYEYADYNYRAYDIGNVFNESMFDYHYPEAPYYAFDEKKYPTEEQLNDFIKYYQFFYRYEIRGPQAEPILQDEKLLDEHIKENYNLEAFQKELDQIREEVKVCSLFSHYYWILWSIVMSKSNDLKFDYIGYGYKRYGLYTDLKKNLKHKSNL